VPSGLNLAGALGIGSLASIGSKLSNAVGHSASQAVHAVQPTRRPNRWLVPGLIALVVVALLIYLAKGCNGSNNSASTLADTAAKQVDTAVVQAAAPVRQSVKVKLQDGTELDALPGGIEDQLVTFLNDPATKAGKNVWFDFDNLNFKTGSADITDESRKQLQDIVAILKAYPKLKIKIGGYTDKTGDSLANLKLSKDRAQAVLAALKSAGANQAQLVGAEGYGSQFAKASADAPDEQRVKDRRISLSVRAK